MKTLEEHQREIISMREKVYKAGTGIECPKCNKELMYGSRDGGHPGILLSDPPQKDVHCDCCNFQTSIYF